MLIGSVSPNDVPQAAHSWLLGFDYEPPLIKQSWSLRHLTTGETDIVVPYMAFWGQPFDLFHTALAVVPKNGVPANDIAARTASNVLLCDRDFLELWLLNERGEVTQEKRLPAQKVEELTARLRDKLCPSEVARKKIQWRQYALYESDPNGNAFRSWSIQPSATQADRVLGRLIRDVAKVPAMSDDSDRLNVPLDTLQDRVRWLFRLLSLRVGKDVGWGVSSNLDRGSASDFATQAMHYPAPWRTGSKHLTDSEKTRMSDDVLSRLEHYDFSTTDPLFVTKAVGSSSLRKTRLEIDLFPTPKAFAWDMMASIPINDELCVCDATAGTGTFLIAAGHAVWAKASLGNGGLPDLGEVLWGGDLSPLSADLARIGLDLAFGWREAGWNVGETCIGVTLNKLPKDRQWALVGNLPWSAKGKSRNDAAVVLEDYVHALSRHDEGGWIAGIIPRSVWTSTKMEDRHLLKQMSKGFQVESSWELPWGAIKGGRSQAIAFVLSKGQPATITVWKQVDKNGLVHTVGYTQPKRTPDDFLSAPARYLQQRLAGFQVLRQWFDVWEGVKFKGGKRENPQPNGTVPVMHRKRDVGLNVPQPQKVTMSDICENGGWVHKNCRRRARAYARGLLKLPQFAIPRHVYESAGSGMQALLIGKPMLLSDAFLISVPKDDIAGEFTQGVAALLNSALGRLWLHMFATYGRDISNQRVMDFPLPPPDKVEYLGRMAAQYAAQWSLGNVRYAVLKPPFAFKDEVEVCKLYGLEDHECAAVLGLSHLMGISDFMPRSWLDDLDETLPDAARLGKLRQAIEDFGTKGEDYSGFYFDVMFEIRKQERLIAQGDGCELSIRKTAVAI